MNQWSKTLKGVVLCFLLGSLLLALNHKFSWLAQNGFGSLTLAIVLGMVLGNLPLLSHKIQEHALGIHFSKQKILRLGIILYGFRLTYDDVGRIGFHGVAIDLLIFLSTFLLALFIGTKILKLDKEMAILIGAGSSICGAAAILATEPVVKANPDKVAVAMATVIIFGTVSMFSYPAFFHFGKIFFSNVEFPTQFGIYIGSTVHEVAQVLAAAKSVGSDVTDTALITKMIRVMMLGPFLIFLSSYLSLGEGGIARNQTSKLLPMNSRFHVIWSSIPWFAFLFILVIGFNSAYAIPRSWISSLIDLDNLLLTVAMLALGISTHLSFFKNAGVRPLILAASLFVWLVVGGGLINIAAMLID